MNNQLRIVKYLVSALVVFAFTVSGCGDDKFTRVKPVAVISANNTNPESANIILITLNGTGSWDPNDEALTYAWTLADIPLGSSAVLVSTAAAITSFIADKSGFYTVILQVTNTTGSTSDIASAILHAASDGTLNPAAVIEANTSVKVNTSVVLNGSSSSDPLDETLTYAWTLAEIPKGSAAALVGSTNAVTSFVADQVGFYTVTLVVTNASGRVSETASVRIDAGGEGGNHPPVAVIEVTESGAIVMLDGSGSHDADGDTISYRWTVVTAGAGALQHGVTSPVFTLRTSATADGTYIFVVMLTVSDGKTTSSKTVSVTITLGDA